MSQSGALTAWAISMANVAMFRAFPFVVLALVSRRVGWRAKVAVGGVLATAIFVDTPVCAAARVSLVASALALAYFGLVSVGVYRWTWHGRRQGAISTFLVLWVACILIPARIDFDGTMVLVLTGWEVLLGAYSYCREHGDPVVIVKNQTRVNFKFNENTYLRAPDFACLAHKSG